MVGAAAFAGAGQAAAKWPTTPHRKQADLFALPPSAVRKVAAVLGVDFLGGEEVSESVAFGGCPAVAAVRTSV